MFVRGKWKRYLLSSWGGFARNVVSAGDGRESKEGIGAERGGGWGRLGSRLGVGSWGG